MAEFPEPRVVTVVREFKRGLLLQEAAHMQAMARRWIQVADSLASLIVDLAARVDELTEEGGTPSRSQIFRLERYRVLLTQTERQFDRYADWASREIVNRQEQLAEQGLTHAVEAIQASYFPNVGVYFDRLPVEAIQTIVGLAGNGAPIGELLRDRMVRDAAGNPIPGVWDKLTEQLIRGTGLGYNPRKTARLMQDRLAGGLQKALTIARTEELRAYRFTNQRQYAASGVVIEHMRLSAHDGRVCAACIAADGETYPVGKVMDDHVQGRCVIEGTEVSGPAVERFYARHYDGDVIIIRTTGMKELTVTPNHPILTDRGWIAAKFVNEGDYVVSSPVRDWTSLGVSPEIYQVPSLIEKIPGSLGMDWFVSVPVTSEDFHGDGSGSEVYVVGSNSFLRNRIDPTLLQQIRKVSLVVGNTGLVPLSALGEVTPVLERLLGAPGGLLSNGYSPVMFLNRRLFGEQPISGGLTAPLDPSIFQSALDRRPGDTIGFSEAVLTLSRIVASGDFLHRQVNDRFRAFFGFDGTSLGFGAEQPTTFEGIREALVGCMELSSSVLGAVADNIKLDGVLEVSRRTFSGHVYNLQTTGDWYLANGIIVHNCTSVPVVRNMPRTRWLSGEDWFRTQDPEVQASILGSGRLEAWRDGQFDFGDLVTRTHDRTWGDGLVPTPLHQLTD